jgi:hypothetical protein
VSPDQYVVESQVNSTYQVVKSSGQPVLKTSRVNKYRRVTKLTSEGKFCSLLKHFSEEANYNYPKFSMQERCDSPGEDWNNGGCSSIHGGEFPAIFILKGQ